MPLLSRRRLYTRSNAALYVSAAGGGGGGGGTVLFDAAAGSGLSPSGTTATFSQGAAGGLALSLDVGSGPNGITNRALLAALFFPSAAAGTITSPSATWNGVAMTLLGGPITGGGNSDMFLFGMTAPATGAKNLVFNWTGATLCGCMTLSVVGAFQTVGSAFHGIANNSGSSATPNVTVSAALANEMTFGAFMSLGIFTTSTNTPIGTNGNGAISSFAASLASGASPAMNFSTSGSAGFAAVGVAVVGA